MELTVALVYFLLVGFAGQTCWSRVLGRRLGRALAIPLTLGALVIVGSVVLSTGLATMWPVILGVIVALGWIVNLTVGWRSRSELHLSWPSTNQVLLIGFAAVAVVISSYSDSITHLGPGHSDTMAHVGNLQTLEVGPLLSQYPVGHYSLLQPISFLVSEETLSRFVGPAFGLLVAIGLYFVAELFVSSSWALAAVAILSSVVMNPFSLVRASLLPSALSFLMVAALVGMVALVASANTEGLPTGRGALLLLFTVLVLAVGLSVPYSLFSFDFALGLWLVLATTVGWIKLRWSVPLLLVSGLGPGVWPLFDALRRGLPSGAGASAAGASAVGSFISSLAAAVPDAPLQGEFSGSVGSIIRELFQVEGLRDPLESGLSLGAYLVIALAVVALAIGWRRSAMPLAAVAFFTLAYGVFTQTGFSELVTYRGRAGWYLSIFSALLVVLLLAQVGSFPGLDRRLKEVWRFLPAVIAGVSMMTVVVAPPRAERVYKEATFVGTQFAAEQLLSDDGTLRVASDVGELVLLASVDSVMPLAEIDDCVSEADLVVLDFSPRLSSEGYLFAAIVDGGDIDSYEAVAQERVRQRALKAIEIGRELEVCGLVSIFTEDGVSVYVHS